MSQTDQIKHTLDEFKILDSQQTVDDLNIQLAKKFVDPNCNPASPVEIDTNDQSFCVSPLQGRDDRLKQALTNLPVLPNIDSKTACAQSSLQSLTNLVQTKFNPSAISDSVAQANFVEEKIEAQLELVTFTTMFAYSLLQIKSLPNLLNATIANINKAVSAIKSDSTDQMVIYLQALIITRLNSMLSKFNNIVQDKKTYNINLAQANYKNAELNIALQYTSSNVLVDFNAYLSSLNTAITYKQRKSPDGFGKVYQNAADKLIASTAPDINDYYSQIKSAKSAMHDATYVAITSLANTGAIKSFAYASKTTPDIQASGAANTINGYLTQSYQSLIDLFSKYVSAVPKPPSQSDVLLELSKLSFCGVPLPMQVPITDIGNVSNVANLDHKTFDVNNTPTITELGYWQHYSIYLNIINLLPIYWTIGLYVPTPGGIVKIPMPTVWKPLAVLYVPPFGLVVIFLTINGIAISPTIWTLKFPPSGNASELTVMLRKIKQKIKDNTGDELLNVPVVNGINVNPDLTKTLPFKQDDLPTVTRLGMNNPPYVLYLNQWMAQYVKGGGLP